MAPAQTHSPPRRPDFPLPDEEALFHSRRLEQRIRQGIDREGGAINFSAFMQAALYEPGLGYYSAGAAKLGRAGDFVTAPEISSLFSRCLARQCEQVLELTTDGTILELGAGSGRMAADILRELAQRDCLPKEYIILETSAALRQRQRIFLQGTLAATLYARCHWLDALPERPFTGLVLANEVMDALPVERICYEHGRYHVMQVACQNGGFVWQKGRPDDALRSRIKATLGEYQPHLAAGYTSEINTLLPAWIHALADSLEAGVLLLIDYGYPRAEYYHPQRFDGTLLCHYRQRAHHDPFLHVGLQDISASVDFTAVAEAASKIDLSVAGYCGQAHFLLSCGLDELLAQDAAHDELRRIKLSGEAKRLTLPAEMGERFKVIALGRGMDAPLLGFRMFDQRERL